MDSPGTGIVELVIALAIGLSLSLAAITIYLNNKAAWRAQSNTAYLQETGRFALHLLREDTRLAGYWGLNVSPQTIENVEQISLDNECANGWATQYVDPVSLVNNTNNGYTACIPDSDYKKGSDILTVRRSSNNILDIAEVQKNGLYLYTSLTDGAVFIADADASLDEEVELVESPAALYLVTAHAYYIRPFSQMPGDGIPTLVRESIQASSVIAEPMAELIEDLQIIFGLDTNGDGNVDVYDNDGIDPGESDKVVSVIVEILARGDTAEAGYTNSRIYRIGDHTRTFNDGYRRQLFRDTVFLRNRKWPGT
jgi:type IV pilus assembly protein PilW